MEATQSAILSELKRLYVNREVHFEHPDGRKASRLRNLFLFWKLPENVRNLQSVYMITPAKTTGVLNFPWEQWVRIKVETEDDVDVSLDIHLIYDWDSYELIRRRVSELFRGKDIDYAYLEKCIGELKNNNIYVPYFRQGSLSLSSPPQAVNTKMIDRVMEPFTVGCGVYILPEGVSKVSVGDRCFRLSSDRWEWIQKVTYHAPENPEVENFSFYVYYGCHATLHTNDKAVLPELVEWDTRKLSAASEPLTREELADKNLDDPAVALECCHYAGLFIRGCLDDDEETVTEEVVEFYKFLVSIETNLLRCVKDGYVVSGNFDSDRQSIIFTAKRGDEWKNIASIHGPRIDLHMHICQIVGFYFEKPITMEAYDWLQWGAAAPQGPPA